MEKEQKKIMLLLTEECNLACSYCYEHHKRPRAMDFAQAQRVIDAHYAETAPGETVLIEVFGGEPFLNFPLMQRIDDYVMTTYGDRVNLFETTTNGTLVHGEVQSWLAARRDRWRVSLSLDGTQAMHDRNRPLKGGGSSYAQIDRDFFLRTWPGTAQAKLTLSEQTLPQLAEGVISLHEQGFVVDATLSTGVDWDFAANEQIFVRELAKLVEFYSAHPELPLCTLLNFDLRLVFAERPSELRFCGAGEMTCCYDAAGVCYPCQGFAPVALGAEAAAFNDFDAQEFSLTADNPCVRCPFFFRGWKPLLPTSVRCVCAFCGQRRRRAASLSSCWRGKPFRRRRRSARRHSLNSSALRICRCRRNFALVTIFAACFASAGRYIWRRWRRISVRICADRRRKPPTPSGVFSGACTAHPSPQASNSQTGTPGAR